MQKSSDFPTFEKYSNSCIQLITSLIAPLVAKKIDTFFKKKKLKIVRFLNFVQILGLTHSSDSIHPNTSSCKKIDTLKKKLKIVLFLNFRKIFESAHFDNILSPRPSDREKFDTYNKKTKKRPISEFSKNPRI